MPVVSVMTPGTGVRLRSGALQVVRDDEVLRTLQTHEVTELHLHASVEVSSAARRHLLREGVDVVHLTDSGKLLGRTTAVGSRAAARRLAQYRLVTDPDRRLAASRQLVAAKVGNQLELLLRRQRSLRDPSVADAAVGLRALLPAIDAAQELDTLRGLEGLAARRYFGVFPLLLRNPAFSFSGRNRHPPRDPVNACLSFGYTLLTTAVQGSVHRAGLDPALGVFHEVRDRADALVYDLVEPWRPLVDRLILRLINRKQLAPADFRTPPAEELGARAELADTACFLADVGRRILIRSWYEEQSRRQTHPDRDEQYTVADLILEQSRSLATWIDGTSPTWSPVRLTL